MLAWITLLGEWEGPSPWVHPGITPLGEWEEGEGPSPHVLAKIAGRGPGSSQCMPGANLTVKESSDVVPNLPLLFLTQGLLPSLHLSFSLEAACMSRRSLKMDAVMETIQTS